MGRFFTGDARRTQKIMEVIGLAAAAPALRGLAGKEEGWRPKPRSAPAFDRKNRIETLAVERCVRTFAALQATA
jgi:hypothetical protein